MEAEERRDIYLEFLSEWQDIKRSIDRDGDASAEELELLNEVKGMLDRAKQGVFAASGDTRDATNRAKAREAIRARIEFVNEKISSLQSQVGSGE